MKALDTNLLVRFMSGDSPNQAKKVFEIFRKAEEERSFLFVPSAVVMELIWTMRYNYQIQRQEIIAYICDLLLLPILRFEHHSAIQRFVRIAENNNFDLSDLMIGLIASECGCETVLTFDKKASRSEYFELVE